MLGNCGPAIESPPPTTNVQMQVMSFSQIVAEKIAKDQGIDFPQTLASISDEVIAMICEVIRRTGGLAVKRIPDSGIRFLYW